MRIIGTTRATTAARPSEERPRGRRRTVAALVATGLVSSSLFLPGLAAAAPPAFPDNVVVFPDRDMVVLEGFADRAGQDVVIDVTRAGQLMGSATGKIPGNGGEFEVNHPGGVCWGVAPGAPKVTPDIAPGDLVSVKFGGAVTADTVVQEAFVTEPASLAGNVLTVKGHVGGSVTKEFTEQRIINPALTATDVNRRDVRAVLGGDAAAPKGGYVSRLEITPSTGPDDANATATYTFNTAATARLAAEAGGERLMSWQEQDDAGNRQGLTIAEFGETGGPGMGGCPAGPGAAGAPAPGKATVVRSADKKQLQVNWTPATQVPGGAAVTGYSVVAITGPAGTQTQVGTRTGASATGTTIPGLDAAAAYTVEVRSMTGTTLSAPMTVDSAAPAPTPPSGPGDTTKPAVTISAAAPVTFTGIKAGDEIYYTLDGSPASVGDMPSSTASLYQGPIAVTAANTVVNWAAFNAVGNRQEGTATFGPSAPAAPGAPTLGTITSGDASAVVNWTPATGGPAPTKYVITATPVTVPAGTTAQVVTAEAPGAAASLNVTRLVNGVTYDVVVAGWAGTVKGADSAKGQARPTLPANPRVTVSSATFKSGDIRVQGTTTAPTGSVVQLRTGSATGTIIASANVVAPVAPSTSGTFDLRNRTLTTNPGPVWVTTVNAGQAGPVTLTAR